MDFQQHFLFLKCHPLCWTFISRYKFNDLTVGKVLLFNISHGFLHPLSQLLTFIAAHWHLREIITTGFLNNEFWQKTQAHLPSRLLSKMHQFLIYRVNLLGHKR